MRLILFIYSSRTKTSIPISEFLLKRALEKWFNFNMWENFQLDNFVNLNLIFPVKIGFFYVYNFCDI